MHDRGDRERGRGFDAGGSSARSPDRQRTPEEEAIQRVSRVSQEIESASTRVMQLAAIVRRDDWRAERAKLQQTHDTLVENLKARELDAKTSARARDHYDTATKKLGDIATALANAQEPARPVPPVAGEEAIEPSIVARNASPDDVLAWVAGLDARERSAIAGRIKTVLGSVQRTDRFAVDLANYLAGSRILPQFYKVADNPRKHFNAAAYAKSRAQRDADATSADDKPPTSTGTTPGPGPTGTTAGRPTAGPSPHAPPVVSRHDSPDDVATDAKQPDTSARKGGPLPYQQEMERSFGRSFAHVEAHTGMAAELQPLGAQAITVGHVMMFADAQPSPPLVAHEATHAVQNQQTGMSAAMASGGVMSEHSPAEAEADAMANRVAQHGLGVRLPSVTQAPTARIARSPSTRHLPAPPPAADRSPGADGNGDATALAERCRLQGYLIVDSYPEFAAGSKLAAMAARLAERAKRLPTMPAADYARLSQLFAQQSSVLYVVAGDLETLATQARKLQRATSSKTIDPRLAGIAELVLDAGASSDLPETAHKQLELAHAKHAAIPFDAMDAMLDDARSRTMATDALAAQWGPGDSGSTKTSRPMTGRQQWEDLRAREDHLSGDVLAARRAHDAGTDKAGATRVLIERTRALQIEAHLVAAETQCGYMSDKLEEQQGVLATIAGQMRDLQRARHDLQALANTMAGIRIRWREKHAQLFALVDSGASADSDPATAIRQAIAELETDLAQVGDEKTKAALETAQAELKDMAIARAVADIAVMIGLTLATSGVGAAAAGAARGIGMGRTAAQLVNVATQSVAMATLRTMLYHDSFSSAFGSELLTNFAGLAALRGVAMGLSKLQLGKSLAILKQGEGAWRYIAHGTELTIEAATQAGLQFATAEAHSLISQGRTLNDDELKMLAIQGIGMFVGNAIAHRLANPALDAIGAYAARLGAPYRRAQVRKLAERVARTGDPEASKELIRAERELVAEELALLQHIARDPAERAQFGETTLATVTEQAHGHAAALTELGVEHSLQHGLDEISPGKAWEGSAAQVEHTLAEARAQGATVHDEQLADGTRQHTVTAGSKRYIVYESSPLGQTHDGPGSRTKNVAAENRGEPYMDPRVDPDRPHQHLSDRELLPIRKMDPVTSWKKAAKELNNGPVVLGKPLKTAADGHALLAELATGKSEALAKLGVTDIPEKLDTSTREWALVQARDGFAIYGGAHDSVSLPVEVRVLAHNHPAPLPEGKHAGRVIDLPAGLNGKHFSEILADPKVAGNAGITPSAKDIHAISDGGDHVIYTRYVHHGDGVVTNPSGEGARVNIHLSDTKVKLKNVNQGRYWYETTMTVRDSNGTPIWEGKVYTDWYAYGSNGRVQFTRPAVFDGPQQAGWEVVP